MKQVPIGLTKTFSPALRFAIILLKNTDNSTKNITDFKDFFGI